MKGLRCLAAAAVALAGAGIGVLANAGTAEAKTPGKTYCYNSVCHRVKTLAEMDDLVGHEEEVMTSYYDDCKVDKYNPCTRLSSGEEHRPDLPDNAASPVYPNGTILLLENPKTNVQLLVRVNNSGPYRKGRLLDVSRAAAEELGFKKKGVARIKLTVISGPIRN